MQDEDGEGALAVREAVVLDGPHLGAERQAEPDGAAAAHVLLDAERVAEVAVAQPQPGLRAVDADRLEERGVGPAQLDARAARDGQALDAVVGAAHGEREVCAAEAEVAARGQAGSLLGERRLDEQVAVAAVAQRLAVHGGGAVHAGAGEPVHDPADHDDVATDLGARLEAEVAIDDDHAAAHAAGQHERAVEHAEVAGQLRARGQDGLAVETDGGRAVVEREHRVGGVGGELGSRFGARLRGERRGGEQCRGQRGERSCGHADAHRSIPRRFMRR